MKWGAVVMLIMNLLGVHSEEMLSEEVVEHYSWYIEHPLDLNLADRKEMEESELFTGFQMASLLDYRKRTGALQSFMELSVLEGFSPDFVEKIRPFVVLSSSDLSTGDARRGLRGQSNLYLSAGKEFKWGGKFRADIGRHFKLGGGFRYNGFAFSGSYSGDGFLSSVVVGNFNARYGQGLGLWSGFSMSGASSIASLIRKPSGIVQSYSYTGEYALSGAAVELSLPYGIGFSAFVDVDARNLTEAFAFTPGMNLSWKPSWAEMSLTGYLAPDHGKVSGDFRTCIRGVDLFCESALSIGETNSVAFLVGTAFPLADGIRAGLHLRYYPSDFISGLSSAMRTSSKTSNEYGFAGVAEVLAGSHSLTVSADAVYFPSPPYRADGPGMQIRTDAVWKFDVCESLSLFSKAGFRVRSYGDDVYLMGRNAKLSVREEIQWDNTVWMARMRADCVLYQGYGLSAALEGGYRKGLLAVYLKSAVFCVDDWDDRIYSYNRDAPGNFSSVAFYGRGVSSSAYLSLDIRFRKKENPGWVRLGKLYLKSVYSSYFNASRPSVFQFKVEYILKL